MLSESQQIIDAIDSTNGPLFLATVVDVVGSAYRRPTARMLILPDGEHIGTISGGCLERDLCRDAERLTREGPKLISFDTRSNSANFNPRYNLGCSGIIYVLVERITNDNSCPSGPLRQAIQTSQPFVCGTVYQVQGVPSAIGVGRRLFSPEHFALPPANGGRKAAEKIWKEVSETGTPLCCEVQTSSNSSFRVLLERIDPCEKLWIFGAGDDARPLAMMAQQLGWNTTVIDHRSSLLSHHRFPQANLHCATWDQCLPSLLKKEPQLVPKHAAVLLTHDLQADVCLLPQLVDLPFDYIGILGPKQRTGKVLKLLHAEGRFPAAESLERLQTPVGLDIGASNAAQIALSVLAEIVAVRNKRSGERLRGRSAPIHEPVAHRLIAAPHSQRILAHEKDPSCSERLSE